MPDYGKKFKVGQIVLIKTHPDNNIPLHLRVGIILLKEEKITDIGLKVVTYAVENVNTNRVYVLDEDGLEFGGNLIEALYA